MQLESAIKDIDAKLQALIVQITDKEANLAKIKNENLNLQKEGKELTMKVSELQKSGSDCSLEKANLKSIGKKFQESRENETFLSGELDNLQIMGKRQKLLLLEY